MAEVWYYAEGTEKRGPLALAELVSLLSKFPDARKVPVWRQGFDDWKAAELVSEIAGHLLGPPPPNPDAASPAIRAPAVSESEGAEFKNIRPGPSGIGGWLVLVAIGQVVGTLRLFVSLGEYYKQLDMEILQNFPVTIWGEVAMNAGLLALMIYTTFLFFRRSRNFPRFFICEWMATIFLPLINLIWVALTFSLYSGRSFSEFVTLEPREGAQIIAAMIGAAVWITYIMRSRRVANTFVK